MQVPKSQEKQFHKGHLRGCCRHFIRGFFRVKKINIDIN